MFMRSALLKSLLQVVEMLVNAQDAAATLAALEGSQKQPSSASPGQPQLHHASSLNPTLGPPFSAAPASQQGPGQGGQGPIKPPSGTGLSSQASPSQALASQQRTDTDPFADLLHLGHEGPAGPHGEEGGECSSG